MSKGMKLPLLVTLLIFSISFNVFSAVITLDFTFDDVVVDLDERKSDNEVLQQYRYDTTVDGLFSVSLDTDSMKEIHRIYQDSLGRDNFFGQTRYYQNSSASISDLKLLEQLYFEKNYGQISHNDNNVYAYDFLRKGFNGDDDFYISTLLFEDLVQSFSINTYEVDNKIVTERKRWSYSQKVESDSITESFFDLTNNFIKKDLIDYLNNPIQIEISIHDTNHTEILHPDGREEYFTSYSNRLLIYGEANLHKINGMSVNNYLAQVPEPSTIMMFLISFAALATMQSNKKHHLSLNADSK